MSNHSRLEVHTGEALCRIAGAYPMILEVILEQVQNSLDANSKNIWVVLSKRSRHIAIRDDGDGVGQEEFDEALRQVCHSQKTHGKLGRFGIGLISPLDKCERSTFTSCPKGIHNAYTEWTFITKDIREQDKDVTVPRVDRRDLFFIRSKEHQAPKGLTSVMWRTEVNIFGYTADKVISRIGSIDDLAEAIFERFGATIRRNNVKLNLKFISESGEEEKRENIRPKKFTGRALEDVVILDPKAGRVFFQMYLAPKTTRGQAGKVLVGESDNDFRIPFGVFSQSTDMLPEEVAKALNSGVFEGEIMAEKIKLHASRKSFERDDTLLGLCTAIEEWFRMHGEKYLEEVQEANRDKRYQELGLDSLRELEDMLRMPEFIHLREVMGKFSLGTVGKGHTPPNEAAVKGKQQEKSLSTHESAPGGKSSKKIERQEAGDTLPKHHPYTVAGPRGSKRTLVKKDSVGLQFSYVTMYGSDRLWELDIREGVLHLNVSHPLWVLCDVSDRKIRQLQETIAINALMIEVMPEDLQSTLRSSFDLTLPAVLHIYHESPAFNSSKKRVSPPK